MPSPTIPAITQVIDPPLVTDDRATFDAKAFEAWQDLAALTTQVNATTTAIVSVGNFAETKANESDASADASALSAVAADASADLAEAHKNAAAQSVTDAAAHAATALNAPGTQATSATSLTIGTGSKALTIQTGKALALGQTVVIASTASPNLNWMVGPITAYNSGSGSMTVDVQLTRGSGTLTAWTVALAAPVGAQVLTTPTLINPLVQLAGSNGTAGQVPVSQGPGLPPVWGQSAPLVGDSLYKPQTAVTLTDALGSKWLRTGSYIPVNAEVTAGLSALPTYASSLFQQNAFPAATAVNAIRFVAGEFWASQNGGAVAYSTDGLTWTACTSTGVDNGPVASNGSGVYVVVNRSTTSQVLRSTNKGASWDSPITVGGAINDIAFGASLFVVVGTTGAAGTILTSPDGTTWTARSVPASTSLNRVIFAGGQFVAVGANGGSSLLITSPDGITWTSRTYGAASGALTLLAYVAGRFVAGNNGGTVPRSSADGITWEATSGSVTTLVDLASTGDVLIAPSNTAADWRTSTDGINFTTVPAYSTDPLHLSATSVWSGSSDRFVGGLSGSAASGRLLLKTFAAQSQVFGSTASAGGQNLFVRYA